MNGDSFFSATSYIASFQKPERYLRDPELRAGRVERPHGGPLRPMDGGGFASVFRVVSADGRKSWAVKCFLRPTAELSDRYRAIEARLADVGDYWKVGFGYDPEGLFHLPENRWVPVLKMTWVNGTRLIPWLEDRLGDAAALRRMALEFTNVIGSLERAGIAHGDLQHGNIIVVAGDRIRLVDYDGMYVPALKGFRMPECGVPHYQPPDRGERGYFGPAADRFSARVIRLGIRAVAADPGLWDRLHETDGEYLILRNTDFAEPDRSGRSACCAAAATRGSARRPRSCCGTSRPTPSSSRPSARWTSPVRCRGWPGFRRGCGPPGSRCRGRRPLRTSPQRTGHRRSRTSPAPPCRAGPPQSTARDVRRRRRARSRSRRRPPTGRSARGRHRGTSAARIHGGRDTGEVERRGGVAVAVCLIAAVVILVLFLIF